MNGAFTHTKPLSESTSFASSYYNRPAGELEVVVFFFCFFLLLLWLCVGFLSQKHTPNTWNSLWASFVPLCVVCSDSHVTELFHGLCHLRHVINTAGVKLGLGSGEIPLNAAFWSIRAIRTKTRGLCSLLFEVVTRFRIVKLRAGAVDENCCFWCA